ncbi:FAD:protein FMN transferase [Sinomonas sp. ASV486]|uniref:FAD:protein FMN transferase n=1 Tax=Sinomonas sp. ASV486 TaxID=3051170 RepID=UPI0027DC7527|nr:FAD:protein FMN transferase [Sinomonas sp. ASV486]MDQ4489154.1 FAD:protein FMN transferase [Sinomonas sp. ASV486]
MQPISDPTPVQAPGEPSLPGSGEPALQARTFVCMGTVVSLTIPVGAGAADAGSAVRPVLSGDTDTGSKASTAGSAAARDAQAVVDRLEAATAVVEDQFAGLDAQFSLYKPTSEASRIARGELSLMEASPLMRDLYADAIRWRRRTDGAFTPERPDGLLDLSGLVKGYAIAEAGRSLAALGLTDWCLNAGGDVLVSGSPTPRPPISRDGGPRGGAGASAWLAGIVDPGDRRTLLGAYPLGGTGAAPDSVMDAVMGAAPGMGTSPAVSGRALSGRALSGRALSGRAVSGRAPRLALATSGSAERGDHIWTVGIRRAGGGAQRPDFVQVSVAASDVVTADVLATAIVAGGRATLDTVTARWDVDVLVVTHDGALLATPGFRAPSAA